MSVTEWIRALQSLATIDQEIAQIVKRKGLFRRRLGGIDCWSDPDFVALDAEYHRLLNYRRDAQANEAHVRHKAPSRFGHSLRDGIETIWIKDVPKGRKIHGIASTSTINSHNYALLAKGMTARLPVPLLSSHEGHRAPIGEIFHIRKRETEVYVIGRLYENEAADHAWCLIERGETLCFSGAASPGSTHLQGISQGVKFYDRWTLGEVSICPKGANPDCTFSIYSRGAV